MLFVNCYSITNLIANASMLRMYYQISETATSWLSINISDYSSFGTSPYEDSTLGVYRSDGASLDDSAFAGVYSVTVSSSTDSSSCSFSVD